MNAAGWDIARRLERVDRVLGRVRGARPGPTLIAVGGIHGNETAGIIALERVLAGLYTRENHIFGDLVFLSGNRVALSRKQRYLGRDLNRIWTQARIDELQGSEVGPPSTHARAHPEDLEQLELLAALDGAVAAARGSAFVLDLHTTSGPGAPFSIVSSTDRERIGALGIPVPVILGLAETLEGTLAGYLSRRGIPSMVFEGGQHGAAGSITASEAAVWLTLCGAGVIRETAFPEVTFGRAVLHDGTREFPRTLEMRYRHAITPSQGFRMLPGFRSFQPVVEGEILARDRDGDVRSPEAGLLLLPLYQPQGEDGFFLVRDVGPHAAP